MNETSKELPLLTFNSLYNVLREEKRTKTLQKLPEAFYEALEKFISDKETEISKLKKETESTEKLKKEMHILKNSKKIVLELLNMRCVKIANIAIKNRLFGEETLNGTHILEKEMELYDIIHKTVKKISKGI